MSGLSPERREELAEAVRVEVFFGGVPEDGDDIRRITDALTPLIAGWLTVAWDQGWEHYSHNPFPQRDGFGKGHNPYRQDGGE